MANRLRQFFESVVFAGLKPGQSNAGGKKLRWLGPLGGPVDRFLSGGAAPTDPLYLSNRTFGQRFRTGLLITIPFLIIGGLVAWALTHRAQTQQQAELSAAEIARKSLPNLADVKVETNRDVQVVEVVVVPGATPSVSGSVINNTSHVLRDIEIVLELTDTTGSQVGAVSTTVEKLEPKATNKFQFPIKQHDAAFVLVREVHSK